MPERTGIHLRKRLRKSGVLSEGDQMTAKPLLYLVQAERRIKCVEPRDFAAEPFMQGEGVTFYTPQRVAEMAAANVILRAERQRRVK